MNIPIIGAGNIGGRLGHAWASKGHDVVFPVRDVNELKTQAVLASTAGRVRAARVDAAVRDAEVVVLAVPFGAVAGVLESAEALGKILIDCTNIIGAPLPVGVASGAELVAKLAPGARVTKAVNAQGAENIAAPRYGEKAATNFYCGDDVCREAGRARVRPTWVSTPSTSARSRMPACSSRQRCFGSPHREPSGRVAPPFACFATDETRGCLGAIDSRNAGALVQQDATCRLPATSRPRSGPRAFGTTKRTADFVSSSRERSRPQIRWSGANLNGEQDDRPRTGAAIAADCRR
jgi:predicted dinucleotide-binding enzyme